MNILAKGFAKRFYNSRTWKKCRESFISYRVSIDGGMCQMCGDELGYIVDHIEEITENNINNTEITLNHDNFQYLCLKCHNKKTFSKQGGLNYYFAEDGEIHPLDYRNK